MLTAETIVPVVEDLLDQYRTEQPRLDRIADYLANQVADIYIPKGANREYRLLAEQSRFNVLPLVVTVVVQNLFIDGYRPTTKTGRAPSDDNAPIWDVCWQANRMDARQAGIYRPACTFGWAYTTVLPGTSAPVITPYSPRQLTAIYDDPVNDEFPRYAMVVKRAPYGSKRTARMKNAEADVGARLDIYDHEFRYEVTRDANGWKIAPDAFKHNLGVVPVVRFAKDPDGDCPQGKVEPLIPVQRQLNQTTFSLLMAQNYGAFKQRWATGMTEEDSEIQARVDAMLVSDSPDTKFGEFSETGLDGFLNSRDKALLFISAVAQIPPHQLVIGAGISNISAEALVALQTGHDHDVADHKTAFGESAEQMLRLAGKALGGDDGEAAWDDTSAQVVWRDTTPRSLAQVADALGKLAEMLDIPVEALWEMIPGITDQSLQRWKALREQADVMDELRGMVEGNPSSTPTEGTPVAVGSGNGANPPAPR